MVAALLMVMLLSVIGLALSSNTIHALSLTRNQSYSSMAFNAAESGA